MFTNYLKAYVRNLWRNRAYTFLNIIGLSVGITCCLLIFHYVAYERSYDRFQQNAGRIVRLRLDDYQEGRLAWQSATVYPAIAPTMRQEFPEVEQYGRLIDANILMTNIERNIKFNENKGYYADPSMLEMLDIHLLEGDPRTALDGPDKIILSATTARKYFGNEDPVGKHLKGLERGATEYYQVTGVFRDYPSNSHLIINHLVSYSTLGKITRTLWHDTTNVTEVIAIPVTWIVMHSWLEDFAYRIPIEWWVFLAGGMAALLIALATVGFQALRAASANPIKSLRSE